MSDRPDYESVTLASLGVNISVPSRTAHFLDAFERTHLAPTAQVLPMTASEELAGFTRLSVELSPLLCIHAGVVSSSGGYVAFPGPSGLGKTTLVAALLAAGFRYVSDEVLASDRHTGVAYPFPRPLALSRTSWRELSLPTDSAPDEGQESIVPPSHIGAVETAPASISHIILLNRRNGAVRIRKGRDTDAVQTLLHRAFNHYLAPEASFRAVVQLVRGATVWRADYEHAPELAAALSARVDIRPAASTASK